MINNKKFNHDFQIQNKDFLNQKYFQEYLMFMYKNQVTEYYNFFLNPTEIILNSLHN